MTDLIIDNTRWLRLTGASKRTVEARVKILRRLDRDLPCGLEAATYDELAEWLDRPHLAAASKATYHYHIGDFYGWATDPNHPVLDYNPAIGLPRVKRRKARARPVTPATLADILTRATRPWRLYSLLAAAAGLRCCEIAGLHREDVTEQVITIREAKGGDEQSVPTHPEIWQAVRHFPAGPLAELDGGRACARWVSNRTATYYRRGLGLTNVSLHRLRHSFGTELRRAGHDLFVIQQLMRHASMQSTQIYVEVGEGERRRAVNTLPIPGSPTAEAV